MTGFVILPLYLHSAAPASHHVSAVWSHGCGWPRGRACLRWSKPSLLGGGGPGQYKAEQQQCCCGTVKIPFKTCVVFWALWDCSILLLAVMTKIHASCTSEQKHNISGFRLPPSQRSRIWCWAYKQMCYRIQKKKKPLDVSCKYLTAVNVIAYKVIFKCSFKHPHNGFGCLLADHVTPPE